LGEIRELTIKDFEALIGLWEAVGLEYKPTGRDTRQHIEKEMRVTPQMFIGAFDGNKLVGSVIGSFDGRKGWINRLAVHPERKRKGLAKQLVANIEMRLRERGAEIIAIMVYDENRSSLETFKSCGYRIFPGVTYLTKRYREDI